MWLQQSIHHSLTSNATYEFIIFKFTRLMFRWDTKSGVGAVHAWNRKRKGINNNSLHGGLGALTERERRLFFL